MKIKVADYIIKFFADKGIDKMFVVYGAANGDLIDAFTRIKNTKYVSIMHEQAAGFAVEGYAKIKNLPGVAIATSGPGGQNFVTPIANCFYDSVPAIFITGQIKTQFLKPDEKVRQIGFQETDIVGITQPITKRSIMVTSEKRIKYELEQSYHLATTGRPGPILLDVPMDIQKKYINIDKLIGFNPKKEKFESPKLKKQIKKFIKDFKKSKRPALLIGGGVRTSGAIKELQALGQLMNVPVFPTWNALDIVTSDYSNYCGRIGTYGGAGRNFGIQNSDLLMTIGCRLSGRITGGNVQSFAREANAIPCLLPMKKVHRVTKTTGKIIRQGKNISLEEATPDDPIYTQGFRIGAENLTTHGWQPQGQSWCLLEPITNLSISPDKLVTTEKIEMSDWEVQDCAVTQVKNTLEKDGKKIMSWQSDPNLNPSIWFYDDTGTQYVVVCSGRHPQAEASLPENIESIKEECQTYGTRYDKKTISKGHFVSVIIADAHDPFDPLAKTNGNFLPLIRGILLNLEISEMESL